jgi:hypothetical protein
MTIIHQTLQQNYIVSSPQLLQAVPGPTDLYDKFRWNIVPAMQSGALIPNSFSTQAAENTQSIVQTSGIINMYTPGPAGGHIYGIIQNRFSTIVKDINESWQARARSGKLEVLTVVQLEDIGQAKLTYISDAGDSDVLRYQSIGDGEQFSYVFLKPFYDNANAVKMFDVIRLGYFVIKFLDKFELSTGIGGSPQFWGIPNRGNLFTHSDRPSWVAQFESETNKMIEKFKGLLFDS